MQKEWVTKREISQLAGMDSCLCGLRPLDFRCSVCRSAAVRGEACTPGHSSIRCQYGTLWPIRSMRLLALVICVTLVMSCGDASRVPKSRAIAYAKFVNLRVSDVPEMGTLVMGFLTLGGPPFGYCTTRVSKADRVVAAESPWFIRSGTGNNRVSITTPRLPIEAVHSVVYVMREASLARRNVAAAQGADAPACVARVRAREAQGRFIGHERYKLRIRATSLPFPLSGVEGYGLRVSGTVAGAAYHEKRRQPFYEDTFGFAVGSSEVILHAEGIVRPIPSSIERRLLSLLDARASIRQL